MLLVMRLGGCDLIVVVGFMGFCVFVGLTVLIICMEDDGLDSLESEEEVSNNWVEDFPSILDETLSCCIFLWFVGFTVLMTFMEEDGLGSLESDEELSNNCVVDFPSFADVGFMVLITTMEGDALSSLESKDILSKDMIYG